MKRHRLTVTALIFCAGITFAQDDWKSLLKKSFNETVSESESNVDSIDFQFAISLSENAGFIDVSQKGEKATKFISLLKEKKDKTPSEVARDTVDNAINLYNIRWYKQAMDALLTAKNYLEQSGLTSEISYLRCISTLGLVSLIQGRSFEAEQYVTSALQSSERLLGKKSAAYATNLNTLAKLDQMLGKYNEAEKKFNESSEWVKEVFGEGSLQNAIIINNLAMLYLTMGRNDQAIDQVSKAVTVSEAALKKTLQGKKSFDNRKFLLNRAYVYQQAGQFAESESTFLSIKNVFENRKQTSSAEYANLLNQISILYMQMGKMDQVEAMLQRAASVYRKDFGIENSQYAKTQHDLGVFYRLQGRWVDAESLFNRAIAIRLRNLNASHPDYVKSVENLALVHWKKGDLAAAYPLFNEAMTKSLDFITNYFPPMSESEKTKFWDVLQPRFQRFYAYAVEASATNPQVLADMFNYQIATKALLLNSTNKVKKAILSSGDATLINDYLAWIDRKESLSRYYALSKEELQQQKIDLPSLEKEANNMERSLSGRSHEFSEVFKSETVTYKQLADLLGDTEVLVEMVRVRGFDKDFTGDSKYVALVLTKGSEVPKAIVIENGALLETRYAKFYKNAAIQRVSDEHSYEQFWSRVDPELAGKKTIYFCPDGVYNQLNVNTFKKVDGDYLLNRYDIINIGNAKDLMAIKSRKPGLARKDAFLLGFPDYGGTAVPLPGTKAEIEGINKILKANAYQTVQKTAMDASEANLKNVKGPSLMHIATHGYFLADTELGKGSSLGVDEENAKSNPLLRSGLILSNSSGQKQDTTNVDFESNDNGVLTAYEAMNLDLEGTDLIVLSACETGLGDVRAGEGVYGLQRAFLVAGANALIMSLWKVDDAATQMLMTGFYTNWVKTGNKQKAFKLAQTQLMVKYKDPYYWGAFVMMGM